MELRPAVRRFAEAMERKLRTHDHDRGEDGWMNDDAEDLFVRLKKEVAELAMVVPSAAVRADSQNAQTEAVDVANFAMMIYDVCD